MIKLLTFTDVQETAAEREIWLVKRRVHSNAKYAKKREQLYANRDSFAARAQLRFSYPFTKVREADAQAERGATVLQSLFNPSPKESEPPPCMNIFYTRARRADLEKYAVSRDSPCYRLASSKNLDSQRLQLDGRRLLVVAKCRYSWDGLAGEMALQRCGKYKRGLALRRLGNICDGTGVSMKRIKFRTTLVCIAYRLTGSEEYLLRHEKGAILMVNIHTSRFAICFQKEPLPLTLAAPKASMLSRFCLPAAKFSLSE